MKSENNLKIGIDGYKSLKVPQQITLSTPDWIRILTKVNLFIATYGCQVFETYLDSMPLRIYKRDGKLLGAYIENKICQEYKLTRFELAEGHPTVEIKEARQMLCYFCEKYLKLNRTEISTLFHKTRHFAKRAIKEIDQKIIENHPFDKKLIERHKRLDAFISAYVDFKPIIKNEP